MKPVSILGYVLLAGAAAYALLVVPASGDMSLMINGSIYATYGILALSLALVWGFAGILSFGQASFFGLGGYAYAVVALNSGDTTLAAFAAIAVAALFALMLGYFMFWGRISDVYLGVITLTISLILYRFFNQTAGSEWTIGVAPLGGFNGIPSTPILTYIGQPDQPLWPEQIYVLAVLVLLFFYVLSKAVLTTRFGRIVVAIRENEQRAELLGYDSRFYKLGIFTLAGAMAGAAGVLFANCVFVSPNMFNLQTSSQLLIWVIVGGLGTLAGPVMACFLLLMLSTYLGTVNSSGGLAWLDPNLVLGILLTAAVLLFPKGLLPMVTGVVERLFRAITARRSGSSVTAASTERPMP
ncbi:branched-chain amino acid ABC transporter permease [Methyloligella solikamskensis]|uniref:Branched-chain amino acid ABC transporter permease n=1 Tax=Methyloligella solikamskensis TaxID=1177756 RepID=A0ABW3J9W6_9HYPH